MLNLSLETEEKMPRIQLKINLINSLVRVRLSPCLRVSVSPWWDVAHPISAMSCDDVDVGDPHPPCSPHPIPVIPIWRRLSGISLSRFSFVDLCVLCG